RDQKPFDALTKAIIPELKDSATSGLQIWSAASSTGQEPLSITMSILEEFGSSVNFHLDATDISSKALDKCKSGVYTGLDVQRGLPIQLLMKYFINANDNQWTAKPELLGRVSYDSFNLLTGNFPFQKYHIIFCRNVLIYQNQANKHKIMEKLTDALKTGGYLILGAGESLVGMNVGLKTKTVANCMVFQKE
ncbi:MAG: protein-glutamate O-methyltransferase CheR, partial [Flavobacteriaceae bacterium]|nr:protein-glutamate O-methyltransferase CheR [Flavobacteriaceae bacterium]